ncbi:LysR family transcriptional regulator [Ancylobacter sp. 6x-1]|uniref:LysR family transcriptional regulator n=1 Tax=Ancylobacter crimeensis TaxID=2579147 RepID=A0ABT0DAF5_9HYPH|nr:LysR family transcriptional regulator [Ancylobacter crimeensis]MCK0196928.1 LysR family transcriptional regulator [Ancylobacter crimeensis]
MDWDLIRVFLAVAREGQILAAARKLGLNHATVARRLDALEAALGSPLFDRRPPGSLLTEAGERLLPAAERIETELLGISDAMRGAGASVSGTVRIGAPDGLGNLFLAPALGTLAQAHPDLVIELVPLPRAFSISKREADLAIGLDVPAEGRLTVTWLGDYTLGVYAARAYVEAHGAPATLEEVARHRVVSGVEDYAYASSLDYAHVLAGRAQRLFRCAGVVGQMEAVRAGIGIGVLHDFAVRDVPELVRILPAIRFRRAYHLFAHPDTRDLARVAACHDFLIATFRENRERFIVEG